MAFKSCVAAAVFLLFLLLVTPTPCLTRAVPKKEPAEVYEIDYRGPETHSYLPPPSRSAGGYNVHHQRVGSRHKSKGMRLVKTGGRGKRTHGHG